MGYFSNGTEGDMYRGRYCSRCIHGGGEEIGCQVWDAHLIYNYDQHDNEQLASVLDMLIPRDKDGDNCECLMFVEYVRRERDQA